jgi:outer membrane protein OmpA-like peptidoglycan-associated protein
MRTAKQWGTTAAIALLTLAVAGCATDPYTGEERVSRAGAGAGIGAAVGAAIGAATASDRGRGALIGAAAGATIGGAVGAYQDRQEAELRERLEGTGVRVQRVGDTVRLIMPGHVTFAVDQSAVQTSFYPVLDSVVEVVRKFEDTTLEVKGFTDSTGSFEYNQQLSERRADSVARYFMNAGVPPGRIRTAGFGPRHPIASNDTASGRAQNRRVELDLVPR